MWGLRRTHHLSRRFFFFLLFLFIFWEALPLDFFSFVTSGPFLGLDLIFFSALYYTSLLSYPLLFFAGLFRDILLHNPLGLSSFLFLMITIFGRYQSLPARTKPFLYAWLIASLVFFVSYSFLFSFSWLYNGSSPPTGVVFTNFLTTTFFFPFFLAFRRVFPSDKEYS